MSREPMIAQAFEDYMVAEKQRQPDEAESLPEKVERLSAECVALSHQLIGVIKERNVVEQDMFQAQKQVELARAVVSDVDKILTEVKGREKLIRLTLSSANRDLISSQSLMKAVHR